MSAPTSTATPTGPTAITTAVTRRTVAAALAALTALAVLIGLAAPAAAQQPPTRFATVDIVPVVPGATETARGVLLVSTGPGSYTMSGSGTGFNPLSEYVSLGYGLNSVPVQTGGTPPCADDGTLGAPAEATLRMFIGAWLPVVGTERTIVGAQTLNGLDGINTVSIRRANVLGATQLLQAGDVRPQAFQIRSCGQVTGRVHG